MWVIAVERIVEIHRGKFQNFPCNFKIPKKKKIIR